MMKFAVIIYSNDPETVWNAFRFANTSLGYDNEVRVFLLGKGVEAASLNSLQYDIEGQMALFEEFGGQLIGCGVCCESRKDSNPTLLDDLQCSMGSMQDLYVLVAESDKVITF